ncbi:hypothetical protein MN608_00491 [Microdochium nivale]|nr:hypothetical protein MN608_00491 [Microdochium nivale]
MQGPRRFMSTQTNLHCTSTLLIRLDIEGHWLSFILAICTGFRGTPEGVVDARCSKIENHPGIGRSKGQSDHLQTPRVSSLKAAATYLP